MNKESNETISVPRYAMETFAIAELRTNYAKIQTYPINITRCVIKKVTKIFLYQWINGVEL